MKKVQEPTVRKTLTAATVPIRWQPLIALVAGIVVMSVVVLSGQELKHMPPAAPTFTVLHSFAGYPTDGSLSLGDLIQDSAGNLYGTTELGGTSSACTYGCGTVFKLSPTGTETILYNFTEGADGAYPQAGLVRDATGNLYGTTAGGGAESRACTLTSGTCGVVFELIRCDSAPNGYEYKVLYRFTGGADGGSPYGGLVRDTAGNLYGTTQGGGSLASTCRQGTCGVVFKLSPTDIETVLHTFTGGAGGANPTAALTLDSAGNLYSTTYYGGAYSEGVAFKLSPAGTETVLHSFAGYPTDGGYPYYGLTHDAAGNLYGTATDGGAHGSGVVFKLSPTGAETVLYSFTGGADGGFPVGDLIQDTAGTLYGATGQGGATGACAPSSGCGVVFKLSSTGTETVLHSFTGGADGAVPSAGLIQDMSGNLFGTTAAGGVESNQCYTGTCGVVFRLAP
jgi:uncharacterized repeat protein (TIGR03803 family)